MAARKKKAGSFFGSGVKLTPKQIKILNTGRAGTGAFGTDKTLAARLNAVIAKESKRVGRSGTLKQALDAKIEMERLGKINPRAHAKKMLKQLENKIPLPILENRLRRLTQVVQNRHAWIARFGGK